MADKQETIKLVSTNGFKLQYVSDELKDDKEVVLAAINNNGANIQYASARLKDDKELALLAIKNNSAALIWVSPTLKADEEIVKEAVRKNGDRLKHASRELRKNKDVVLLALKNNGHALEYVDETLKKDKEVLREAIKTSPMALIYAKEVLKDLSYKDVVLEALKQDSRIYLYLSSPLKDDPDIIALAEEREREEIGIEKQEVKDIEGRLQTSIEHEKDMAREKVKNNLEKIKAMQVVEYNGLALKNFSELNDDEDIVEAAVKSNGRALEFASKRLKNNERIAELAISEDIRAFDFVSPRLKTDPEFLKKYNYYKDNDDRKYTKMPKLPKENSPMSAFIGEYQEADLDKFIDSLNSKQTNHL